MAAMDRLIRVLELTRSDHEALSAIRTANAMLKAAGNKSWREVLDPVVITQPAERAPRESEMSAGPSTSNRKAWEAIFKWLMQEVVLNEAEQTFVGGVFEYLKTKGYLTEKQKPWIYKLYREKGGDRY